MPEEAFKSISSLQRHELMVAYKNIANGVWNLLSALRKAFEK